VQSLGGVQCQVLSRLTRASRRYVVASVVSIGMRAVKQRNYQRGSATVLTGTATGLLPSGTTHVPRSIQIPGNPALNSAPRFTLADVERAADEWGCNCGPASVAAICGLTLDEVRPHLGDFERKHHTNPTLMWGILRSLGVRFSCRRYDWTRDGWPTWGLARVQWEGPWTAPGVPPVVAYRFSHWVGAKMVQNGVGIFDVNCLNNGSGWCSVKDWTNIVVPWITKQYPRANGGWHITHAVEIEL